MSTQPPGWYPDPRDSRNMWYWDGKNWFGPAARPVEPKPYVEPIPQPQTPPQLSARSLGPLTAGALPGNESTLGGQPTTDSAAARPFKLPSLKMMAWSFAAVVGGLLVILTLVTGNANGPDQRTRPTPWAAQFSATPSREPTPSAKPEIVDVATCTTAIPPEDIPELVSGMISGKLSDGESVTAVEFADRTISVAADLTGSDTTLSPDKLAELRFTSLTAPLVAPTSPTRTTIDTSWQCFYAQWGTVTVTFNGMSPVTMTKADLLDKEGGGYYFDPAKISAASKAAYIPPTTQAPEPTLTTPAPTTAPPPATDVYYKNCDEARAAGAAPIREGAPGYRPGLDRDKDGWACE